MLGYLLLLSECLTADVCSLIFRKDNCIFRQISLKFLLLGHSDNKPMANPVKITDLLSRHQGIMG